MSDDVKCRVHVPCLGLGQDNYLDVHCSDTRSPAIYPVDLNACPNAVFLHICMTAADMSEPIFG